MCIDCKDCEIYKTSLEEACPHEKGFGQCCEECGDTYCSKRETGEINAFDIVF